MFLVKTGFIVLISFALVACASIGRIQYTASEATIAEIPGMPHVRFYGDTLASVFDSYAKSNRQIAMNREPITYLAISGGGPNGAFGAGLLKGLSDTNRRPYFTIISGVSTGALMAPFVFLGPAYDPTLAEVYTSGIASKLTRDASILNALFGDAIVNSDELGHIVESYIDQDILDRVGAEYRKGRRLFVATTNLDLQRSVIWDMGAIANSGSPEALSLFRQVLIASASIPGLFPPRLIKVAAEGRYFEEMHVDGGTIQQAFVAPDDVLYAQHEVRMLPHIKDLYVLFNMKVDPEFSVVEDNALKIGARSLATVLKHEAHTSMLATYAYAQRHDIRFHLAVIDPHVPEGAPGTFDTTAMRNLYALGEAQGHSAQPWESVPVLLQVMAQKPVRGIQSIARVDQ